MILLFLYLWMFCGWFAFDTLPFIFVLGSTPSRIVKALGIWIHCQSFLLP